LVSVVFDSWGDYSIGSYIFYGCVSLMKVSLPFDLITIPVGMFYGCSSLKTLLIPSGVISIQSYALYKSGLSSIQLSSNLEGLGPQCFGFSAIEWISIGSNVFPRFSEDVFIGCESLSVIHLRGSTFDSNICGAINFTGFPRSSEVIIEVEYASMGSVCGRKPVFSVPTPSVSRSASHDLTLTKTASGILSPSRTVTPTNYPTPTESETPRKTSSGASDKSRAVSSWIVLSVSIVCVVIATSMLCVNIAMCRRLRNSRKKQNDLEVGLDDSVSPAVGMNEFGLTGTWAGGIAGSGL
jgi:hypothetical protein